MGIRRAFKWAIHLYDGLTYLRVLADLLLPIPTTSKWCLKTTWINPLPSHPHLCNSGKTLPYLPSHPGKLTWPQRCGMFASGNPFQADHVQTSNASSWNSRGKFPEGGEEREMEDICKVIWLFLFDTVHWAALHAAKFGQFNAHSVWGEDIWRTWAHLGCSQLPCPSWCYPLWLVE